MPTALFPALGPLWFSKSWLGLKDKVTWKNQNHMVVELRVYNASFQGVCVECLYQLLRFLSFLLLHFSGLTFFLFVALLRGSSFCFMDVCSIMSVDPYEILGHELFKMVLASQRIFGMHIGFFINRFWESGHLPTKWENALTVASKGPLYVP